MRVASESAWRIRPLRRLPCAAESGHGGRLEGGPGRKAARAALAGFRLPGPAPGRGLGARVNEFPIRVARARPAAARRPEDSDQAPRHTRGP